MNRPYSILVLDAWLPTPDRDSASQRMVNLLAVLQELGANLTFAADDFSARPSGRERLQARGVHVLMSPIGDHLAQAGNTYDAIFLSRLPVADKYFPLVQAYAPHARVIFDTTDLHHLRAFRAAKLTGNLNALRSALDMKRKELALVRACDATLVVSPLEQNILEQECPAARVHLVSNIHPTHGCAAPFSEREGIVFVGAFPHHPNADAMHYFFQEIYPLLRDRLDAPLTIIGSEPPHWLKERSDPKIRVTGYVRDLAAYLNRCRLTIAPLRYGAGVKGKVLESMSYGVPVVATSIAAEGIPAQDGCALRIADDPHRFADAVMELYTNQTLWNELSINGLVLIENYFSASVARAALVRLFQELVPH